MNYENLLQVLNESLQAYFRQKNGISSMRPFVEKICAFPFSANLMNGIRTRQIVYCPIRMLEFLFYLSKLSLKIRKNINQEKLYCLTIFTISRSVMKICMLYAAECLANILIQLITHVLNQVTNFSKIIYLNGLDFIALYANNILQ